MQNPKFTKDEYLKLLKEKMTKKTPDNPLDRIRNAVKRGFGGISTN